MMETSEVPEYNPEQLILKTPVEQLCNEDIKIVMESTTVEKEMDTILSILGYNEEEQNQIRRKYNQIIMKENQQQFEVTQDLNKKRKRNIKDNEKEEQSRRIYYPSRKITEVGRATIRNQRKIKILWL